MFSEFATCRWPVSVKSTTVIRIPSMLRPVKGNTSKVRLRAAQQQELVMRVNLQEGVMRRSALNRSDNPH